MEYKRLKEIQKMQDPTLTEVVEVTTENILSTHRHSKDIKNILENILAQLEEVQFRLDNLETQKANVFQVEIQEDFDNNEKELTLDEELALEND